MFPAKINLLVGAILYSIICGESRIFSPVGKCCPPGEIFSVAENFTCTSSVENKNIHELYSIKNVTWGHENLTDCSNSTVTSLTDLIDFKVPGLIACMDLLYDDKLEYMPFIFHCRHDEESIPAPRLAHFRTCCSKDRRYDVETRDCVRDESMKQGDIVKNIRQLLDDTIEFVTVVRGSPTCDYAIVDYVFDLSRDVRILNNGTFQVMTPLMDGQQQLSLTEDNSCLDVGLSPDSLVVRLCSSSSFCESNTCLRKCCPEGQAWIGHQCQIFGGSHVESPGLFHREIEKFVEASRENITDLNVLETSNYGLLVGKHFCEDGMYPVLPNESWYINARGHVHVPTYKVYQHHEYCIDMLYDIEDYKDGLYPCVCFDSVPMEITPVRFGVNAALELTSCAFLLLTFLVYMFLPLLQNLHGKTLMCHVASLFVAYACLATVALIPPPDAYDDEDNPNPRDLCKFLGYTMLFAFLACFSWLNVMCFDIWWTFGGLEGVANIGGRRQAQRKRFLIYSMYAWGFSSLVTSLAVAVDHTNIVAQHLRPNIAIDSCWFEQHWSNQGEMIYFIGPVSIQLVINMIFFIMTSRHCSRVKAEIMRFMTTSTDLKSRQFRADKTKLIMNIKLFIVMGVSWILEIASYFLNHYATSFSWRAEFFYVSDAVNCLQGLLIFILFVLKSKVYYALMHRLGRRKRNRPASLGGMSLQDPHRVLKSASCSTLMSTFGPVNSTP